MTDQLIVEGLVLTLDANGSPHLAPMGPLVDRGQTQFTLRPFCTSQTFANLQRTGICVFHTTDDVELLAAAAIGRIPTSPAYTAIEPPPGQALADCCRWFALKVVSAQTDPPRATFRCAVVGQGNVRHWLGFNRAKHAVVEAAILATRIGILPTEEIRRELARLEVPVKKTAGLQESRAWSLLTDYVQEKLGAVDPAESSNPAT